MTTRRPRNPRPPIPPHPHTVTTRHSRRTSKGKWQKIWDDKGTFWAANVNGDLKDGKGRNADGRPAYFAMDMFPYPSGKGLHVGHPLGYLASDVAPATTA